MSSPPFSLRPQKQRRYPWDTLRWAKVSDFSGGLDDTSDVPSVQPNAGLQYRNVHWRQRRLEKRAGSAQIGQTLGVPIQWVGLFYDIEHSSRAYMCIAGDKLLYLDTADPWGSTYGTWKGVVSDVIGGDATDVCCSGTGLCAVQQYKNCLWITDGVTAKRYTEQPMPAIMDWSYQNVSAMPAPVLVAESAGGSLTNPGAYQIKVTYYNPDLDEETNGSPVSNVFNVSHDNKKVSFTYGPDPNWNDTYSTIKIYRTKADGAIFFYELSIEGVTNLDTVALQVSFPASCFISVSDSSLADDTVPLTNDPVTPAKYILLFEEVFLLWGFPDARTTVRYSDVGKPWSFPALNFLRVNEQDGQALQSLHGGYHQVVAVKERSTHLLSRDESFAFVREEIPQHWGSAAPLSAVSIDNLIFGLDQKGPWSFDSNHFTPVGARIQTFLESVRAAGNFEQSFAVAPKTKYGNWYMLWVSTVAGANEPDSILVFDTRSQGWAVWDGIPARCGASLPHTDKEERIWLGTYAGKIAILEKDIANPSAKMWQDYTGSAVAAQWMSGPLVGDGPDAEDEFKTWSVAEVTFERHSPGKAFPITLDFFREMDDLRGMQFTSITYTPNVAQDQVKTARLWLPKAMVSRAAFVRLTAWSNNQEMLVSSIRLGYSPSGRRLK